MEFMFSLFINFICGGIFVLLGYSFLISKKPVSFWSGSEVKESDVTNVSKYNKSNAVLWFGYSAFFWLAGITSIFSGLVSIIFDVLGCTLGVVYLIGGYSLIKRKYFISYRDSYIASRLNDFK